MDSITQAVCKNKKKKKRVLSYCLKSHRAGFEPGTVEFFTNALTNDPIDHLWILKFLFFIHSAY